MDLAVSAAERDFRNRARTWLAENVPRDAAPDDPRASQQLELAWQREQFDSGWAGVNWPSEYGGLGLSLAEQLIWYEE